MYKETIENIKNCTNFAVSFPLIRSVTDSILRYRDIGHLINTLSCYPSFAVSSLRVVCTVVVRVF